MTTIKRFRLFGLSCLFWFWKAEKRLNAKGMNGYGFIVEWN